MTKQQQLALEFGQDEIALFADPFFSPELKLAAAVRATTLLKPLCDPALDIPAAPFALGTLAQLQASATLASTDLPDAERDASAISYLEKAVEYYTVAAGLSQDARLSPARAKNALAQFYEDGMMTGGAPDQATAWQLRNEAAKAGLAEAQINLAIMAWHGKGCDVSAAEAKHWINQAVVNKAQLAGLPIAAELPHIYDIITGKFDLVLGPQRSGSNGTFSPPKLG